MKTDLIEIRLYLNCGLISSIINRMPAKGALKAAVKPAAAPVANSVWRVPLSLTRETSLTS